MLVLDALDDNRRDRWLRLDVALGYGRGGRRLAARDNGFGDRRAGLRRVLMSRRRGFDGLGNDRRLLVLDALDDNRRDGWLRFDVALGYCRRGRRLAARE